MCIRCKKMLLLLSRMSELMFVLRSAMAFADNGKEEVVTVDVMWPWSMIVELIKELVRPIGCGNWARRSMSLAILSVAFITVAGDFERLLLLRILLLGDDLLLLLEWLSQFFSLLCLLSDDFDLLSYDDLRGDFCVSDGDELRLLPDAGLRCLDDDFFRSRDTTSVTNKIKMRFSVKYQYINVC